MSSGRGLQCQLFEEVINLFPGWEGEGRGCKDGELGAGSVYEVASGVVCGDLRPLL